MFHHHVVNDCITFLNDPGRNRWYQKHLTSLVKDKCVLEVGCGSGILAAYALEAGCRYYYGVDIKSDRARFTSNILDQLGYKGRHTVWCGDGASMTQQDLPEDVDVLICEQTGYQMQSNFTIKQFWKNLCPLIDNVVSVPNAWHLDAYLYQGLLDSALTEYQPKALLPDPDLPKGYYQALLDTDFVRPSHTVKDVFKITPSTANQDIEFLLDLSLYESATVVLRDSISFQNDVCPSSSALTDWPHCVKILIPQARGVFRFRWDTSSRQSPLFTRGFWQWEKISD